MDIVGWDASHTSEESDPVKSMNQCHPYSSLYQFSHWSQEKGFKGVYFFKQRYYLNSVYVHKNV